MATDRDIARAIRPTRSRLIVPCTSAPKVSVTSEPSPAGAKANVET